MQTGFNQAFGGLSYEASINSSNAFYPLGGIRNFRSPLEGFVRYDWDLPPSFDTYLCNAVVNSRRLPKETFSSYRRSPKPTNIPRCTLS